MRLDKSLCGVDGRAWRTGKAARAKSTSSQLRCAECGKAGKLKVCDGCNDARYCSKDCQTRDWLAHKAICHEIGAAKREAKAAMQK
jgi:hypothetical protein